MTRSKSVPSPSLLTLIISRFSSKTVMPVPSKVILVGSLADLNLKKTHEDMLKKRLNRISVGCNWRKVR